MAAPALLTDTSRSHHALVNPNAPYAVLKTRTLTVSSQSQLSDAPLCDPANLAIAEVSADSQGNERSVAISFRNRGASVCQLNGYPYIAYAEKQAEAANLTIIHKEDVTSPVVLEPKGSAVFSLHWLTGDHCSRGGASLAITAPGTSQSFSLNRMLAPCDGKVEVTAVRAADSEN